MTNSISEAMIEAGLYELLYAPLPDSDRDTVTKIYLSMSRASQPVDGTVDDVAEAPLLSERSVNAGVGHAPGSAARDASVTPPLDSEAVAWGEQEAIRADRRERLARLGKTTVGRLEEALLKAGADWSTTAMVRCDDLRALLSLAKPVGGE